MNRKKSKSKQTKKVNKKKRSHKRQTKFVDLLGYCLIILLGIIIYSNSFNNPFLFDDIPNIVEKSSIRNLFDVKSIWSSSQTRFLPLLSFALNYHFGEFEVWGYHLVNLIIHLINSLLVYWFTFLILSSPAVKIHEISKSKKIIALFTALLFVSHPLATQSVTYIVQRMASMAAMFYLFSLVCYLKARLSHKRNYSTYSLFVLSFVFAIMAMLSKENSFTLPFAVLLVEIFFLQTKKLSINFKDYRFVLVLVGLLGFILFVLFNFSFEIFSPRLPSTPNNYTVITSQSYLLTQFSVIVKYIQLLILPVNQNLDYDFHLSTSLFEIRTILSFLLLTSLVIFAVFQYKKNRIISFGILWFFLTLSIESSIIPIDDLIYEHRTYLPSFGFFLILSTGIYILLWKKYKYMAIVIFVLMIGANSFLSYERNKDWKNEFTLWTDVISKSPHKARAYNNRGLLLRNTNRFEEMYADFNKAIELQPMFVEAYNNRGNIYKKQGKYNEAYNDFNKAIELQPKYVDAYNHRGTVSLNQGKYNEAYNDFNKAIDLDPGSAGSYNNRANIYIKRKEYNEAIADLNKAIELRWNFAEAYMNRGITYLKIGFKDKGCNDFSMAKELGFPPATGVYNKYCR